MLCATIIFTCGEVPKRPKGADSKSARRVKPCVGSNPTFSAINKQLNDSITESFFLYFMLGGPFDEYTEAAFNR